MNAENYQPLLFQKNNDRFIKNLSKANLTDNQIKLLSKGLKFIQPPQ